MTLAIPPRRRNVLAISIGQEDFRSTRTFLQRAAFEVDRFPGPARALDLIARVNFAVLVVGYPLPEMDLQMFLDAVRDGGSPCRRSPLLLVAAQADVTAAGAFIGRGANRVVRLGDESLRETVAALLDVAPRIQARLGVRLEIPIDGRREAVFCQCHDLSKTGMLLETDRRYPVGAKLRLDISLPNDEQPVACVAEVVRHTTVGRERANGMAVRFVLFESGAGRRIERYLADRMDLVGAPR